MNVRRRRVTARLGKNLNDGPKLLVLGQFRLIDARGTTISVRMKKGRALLGLLALERGTVSRQALSERLWEDADPKNLRQLLYEIQQNVPLGMLRVEREGVSLDRSIAYVDVTEFDDLVRVGSREALERAVRLYRGEFLHGLDLGEPLNSWLHARRLRLTQTAIDAFTRLALLQTAQKELKAAINTAIRLLEVAPGDDTYVLLMTLYVTAGRRQTALALYERYRKECREQQIPVSDSVMRLHRKVMSEQGGAVAMTPVVRPDESFPQ